MNFIKFHSEKNFIISGVCLSGVCLIRSLSRQEFVFPEFVFQEFVFQEFVTAPVHLSEVQPEDCSRLVPGSHPNVLGGRGVSPGSGGECWD